MRRQRAVWPDVVLHRHLMVFIVCGGSHGTCLWCLTVGISNGDGKVTPPHRDSGRRQGP